MGEEYEAGHAAATKAIVDWLLSEKPESREEFALARTLKHVADLIQEGAPFRDHVVAPPTPAPAPQGMVSIAAVLATSLSEAETCGLQATLQRAGVLMEQRGPKPPEEIPLPQVPLWLRKYVKARKGLPPHHREGDKDLAEVVVELMDALNSRENR